jgi:hypothetical protein
VSVLFSPPPSLKVSYLGPLLVTDGFEGAAAREAVGRRFIRAAAAALDDRFNARYTHVRTTPAFADPRPLGWSGYDFEPGFTYLLDLTVGRDALLSGFSSDARSNVTDEPDCVSIEVGAESAIEFVVEQVIARYEQQGETYGVTPEFVTDLYEALPGGMVRPYLVRVDGVRVSGMVALADDATLYRWQGGAKPEVDLPVNDLLDWRLICDGIDDGIETYDLVGANNERLASYKAKFGPELATYYNAVDSTPALQAAAGLYKRLR